MIHIKGSPLVTLAEGERFVGSETGDFTDMEFLPGFGEGVVVFDTENPADEIIMSLLEEKNPGCERRPVFLRFELGRK